MTMHKHVVLCLSVSNTSLSILINYRSIFVQIEKMAAPIELNNGHKQPQVGYGTWLAKPGEVERGVACALKDRVLYFVE